MEASCFCLTSCVLVCIRDRCFFKNAIAFIDKVDSDCVFFCLNNSYKRQIVD